jgi:tetratricopeptide (TPR) repeat protein
MSKPEIYKYNPSLADPRELEATFVGRECLLDELLDKLRKQSAAKSNQHLMIVGPRGIGKTNTLLLIQNRIRNDEALSKTYLPLTFSEEEYSIISLRDFFVKIFELLQESDPSTNSIDPASVREAPDEEAVERSIALLKEYSAGKNQKLLLFIDNFDLIFSEQIKQERQARRLRDVIMNDNFLFLIGAAPSYFGQIMEYERSFYNFFQIYHLDEFDTNLMEAMLIRRAEFEGNRKLIDQIKEYRPRLEGLRHLTGGNPRLVLMLYQILSASGLPEVKTALNSLLDDLTPYYKHKLESIRSPQQRKIVDTLARMDRAATPTELADRTRLPVNQVSSLIKRLQDEGYLRPASQKRRRTTYYILSERLFRIWHQMRYSTVRERRLPFLVEFIGLWYSMYEIKNEYTQLESRFEMAYKSGKTKDAMFVPDHIGYLAESAPSVDLKSEMFDSTIQHYMDLGEWDAAQTELESELKRHLKDNNNKQAAKYYFGLGNLWNKRAEKSLDIKNYQKVFQYYQSAVSLNADMDNVWYNWGTTLTVLAGLKDDEDLYREAFVKFANAVELKPNKHESWNNWGIALNGLADLLGDEGLYREALTKYAKAAGVKSDMHEAWYNWGNVLCELAQLLGDHNLYGEAIVKYSKAVKVKSDKYEAWNNWGNSLCELARQNGDEDLYREAFTKYAKSVESKPDLYMAWNNWGNALFALARLKSSEELLHEADVKYTKVVEIKADEEVALYNLALISDYLDQLKGHRVLSRKTADKYKHAITIMEKSIKLIKSVLGKNDNAAYCWFALSRLMFNEVQQNNQGKFKDYMQRALVLKEYFTNDEWNQRLMISVHSFFSKEKMNLFNEIIEILKKKKLDTEIALFQPYSIACEYWQKNGDSEILERLNPELREMVEAIINQSEKSSDSVDKD